jgi:HEAT repeat protein
MSGWEKLPRGISRATVRQIEEEVSMKGKLHLNVLLHLLNFSQRRIWTVLAVILPLLGLGVLWCLLQGPKVGETQQIGNVGQDALRPVPCEFPALVSDFRDALREGSPALQRYLGEVVTQVAAASSLDELRSLVAQEQDPQVLEALARATVLRSHVLERIGDATELQPLLDRLATEGNPVLRAVVVRSLGETLEPVSGLYASLIQDPAPEVREAVVANIVAAEQMSYGHDRSFAERVIAVAVAARNTAPGAGARIFESADIRTASTNSVNQVLDLLLTDNVALRKGVTIVLGTVGVAEAQQVLEILAARYGEESERSVRKSTIQTIVRLGFANSAPILSSLRGVDGVLDAEIDIWLAALQLNRQDWKSLLREKENLAKVRGL